MKVEGMTTTSTIMSLKSRAEKHPKTFEEFMDYGVEQEEKGERFGHGTKPQRCEYLD